MTLALQGKPKGRQWLLVAFALLAVIAAAGASLVVRSANADGSTPLSNQASLGTGVSGTRTCAAGIPFYEVGKEGEWHFIINGLASEAVAPTHIHATFAVAGTVQINRTAFNGGSAHYTLTSNLTDTLLSAAAPLTGVDYNNFVLSHAPCTVKVNPNITTTLHLGTSAGEGVTPTTVAVGGSVAYNSVLHDSATVGGSAGAATGTVTFKFFNNKTCTGTPVSTSAAIALVGGVAHPSQDVSALVPGDYGFLAHYNGEDSDYNAIDDNECEWFHVRANPSGNVSVVKTAAGTYERHCTWTLEKSVDKTSVVLSSDNSEATLTYTVKWTKECVDSKFVISGNITVANAGTSPDSFEITDVKDVLPGAVIDCGDPDDGIPFTLAPGAQKVCTYSATAASAAAGVNTASATVDGVDIGSPPVDYTFTLGADTGETALLNDALLGIVNKLVSTSGSLETGNTYKVELGEGCQQTTVRNVAVLTPAGGEPIEKTATTTVDRLCIEVSKTAAGTFDRTCRWDLDKKVDDNSKVVLPGGTGVFNYTVVVDLVGCDNTDYEVHGTITVANTGSIAVVVDVTDAVADLNGDCSVTDGEDAAIAAGASKDFEYSCTFDPDKADSGTNTASATATAGGVSVTETGSKGYSFALDKLVDGCVAVSDTLGEGPNTIICEKDGDQTYPYAHTWTASEASCRAEDFKNTATLTGDGDRKLDSDEVTVTLEKVCVTISKLADLDYTRTCTPDVNKSALEETAGITLGQGQTGTIHWKVEATLDCANKDGVVSGTITVKNTGSIAATLVVTDTLATVVCPDYTLDPGQEVVCTYSAAHAIEGGTNSATAKLTADGVEASATATDPFEVVAKPQGCYTVTDSNSPNTFQLCDTGLVNHYEGSFSYNQTVGPYALGCTERTVDNTAIVTRGERQVDSDKASVVIRVPCLRGFTVGFWGNQNGEARLHLMGDPVVNLSWNTGTFPVNFATGQLILPNNSNFCGLPGVSCTKATLDSGVNPNSVNNLAQQTLALSYNSLYRGATFSNQTLGFMGCTVGAGLTPTLSPTSTIADALAYANYVLGNVSAGGVAITQTQVGAVNTLLGGCLNLEN